MRKSFYLLASLLLLVMSVNAQQVQENTLHQITVHYNLPDLKIVEEGSFVLFNLSGYLQGGEVGSPSLPVCNSLLSVPFCDGMEIIVSDACYDTLTLDYSQLRPRQPSRFKNDTSAIKWYYNEKVYSDNNFYQLPLASVEPLGIGRDRNLALLSFAPVSYNPVSHTAVICRSADITVRFRNADAARTTEYYNRYHTPAFSLGETLNELAIPKSVTSATPLRMVILAGSSLQCHSLKVFADWKRSQGMLVDIIYINSGRTAANIGAQIKTMYLNATEESPAPTFLLLVGDREQLPAYKSKLSTGGWYDPNDHITDLYYTTWTDGDNIPDCYWGRFSATDTTTLNSIIDKTLYYEKYLFEKDDYLARAALVAGVDDNYGYGYKYADPTMDYAAAFYVNSAHGFDTVRYYKNNADYTPLGITVDGSTQNSNTTSLLRSFYNTGAGWINYSAHGDWNCWYDPSFNVNNANAMTNYNMPSFMIGNCCLTNKFDKGTCFGEALLRRGNRAGAVAYIGGTNSTLWDEDFYWSVGIRSNINNTMTPQYDASRTGTYDHLFHTHGEALESHVATAGKLIVQGNMSVESSTTSYKTYYWEIYELMGDPSLMPWLGRASTLQPTITKGGNYSLDVQSVPGAYVALVQRDSMTVRAAAFAGTDGNVHLSYPASLPLLDCFVTITAQGYRPYTQACDTSMVGIISVSPSEITLSPNPASDHCMVKSEGLEHVSLINTLGQTLRTATAANGQCTLQLDAIPAGLYLLRMESATGTQVKKLIVK